MKLRKHRAGPNSGYNLWQNCFAYHQIKREHLQGTRLKKQLWELHKDISCCILQRKQSLQFSVQISYLPTRKKNTVNNPNENTVESRVTAYIRCPVFKQKLLDMQRQRRK